MASLQRDGVRYVRWDQPITTDPYRWDLSDPYPPAYPAIGDSNSTGKLRDRYILHTSYSITSACALNQ